MNYLKGHVSPWITGVAACPWPTAEVPHDRA